MFIEMIWPQLGDKAILCNNLLSGPGKMKSGIITQWNEETGVFSITDEITLEGENFDISDYSRYFNIKGGVWFFDHKSCQLPARK